MKKVILAVLICLCVASVAYAGVLMQEWTDGTSRYCKYSDGEVLRLDFNNICPSYN